MALASYRLKRDCLALIFLHSFPVHNGAWGFSYEQKA